LGALVAAASLLADAPAPQGAAVEQPVIALPAPTLDAASDAPAAVPPADPPPTQAATPQAVEPAPAPTLPALPQRAIAERPIHTVPEDAAAPPPRPLDLRDPSRPGRQAPAPTQSATAEGPLRRDPMTGLMFRPFADLQLPSATAPPREPVASRPAGSGTQVAGAAEASGATALRIGSRPVVLFGIRPPATGDRCAAGGAAPTGSSAQPRGTLPCAEQARGILAAHLAHKTNVSCRFPAASRAPSAAICLDGDGVDLAGMLVAEGLATADPAQSYDYVGAESIARTQKRGLWLFR
jgi:endonuclease YncB( thermonuclease family)